MAQSKLQALLAQLDKGGDYGTPMNSSNKKYSIVEILNYCIESHFSFYSRSALDPTTGATSKYNPMGRWQSTLEMTDFEKGKVDR